MKTCDWCNEEGKLENWGLYMLCKPCAEILKEKYGDAPKSDISDLRIEPPRHGAAASYDPDTGETELRESNRFLMSQNSVFESINHEFIHFLLHKMFDIRCCYQFDSVEKVVDEYHSLR